MQSAVLNPILSFSSEEELEKCLLQNQIDPSSWRGIKVKKLYDEIQTGECTLEFKENRLLRKVSVVNVYCFYTSPTLEKFELYEEKQILPNGEIRNRNYSYISEKMKPQEMPHQASVRALEEELQIADPEIIFEAIPGDTNNIKESSTYIGLLGQYLIYSYKCEIPQRHYKEMYIEYGANETHFSWKKI